MATGFSLTSVRLGRASLGYTGGKPSDVLPKPAGPREVERWEIAFLHGELLKKVAGAIDWVPITESRRTSSP